jgi:hypothetical protein
MLSGGVATAAPPEPAAWMDHVVQVQLRNLPKNYSCYDLWYKFRAVLQKIGARPDWKITTQGCFFSGNAPARSPQVELQFYLPEALTPAQARWADVSVVPRAVTLEPDHAVHSLDKSDCALLAQIKDGLLPALPLKVTNAHLACGSPEELKHGYTLSVQALIPVPAKP